jgi:two-component system, OmpR family, response regulator
MRILVVEDEPDLMSGIVRALRTQGYFVDSASDGDEGLFKAQSVDYDAVLLDVMLPLKDGWTVLKHLRQSRQTPVLMLTARDSPADRVRGLDTGADDYLVKPFDLSELLARVRALIRRSAGQPSPAIEIGEIRIDQTARKVTREGTPVVLTAREYVILEYLALHRGTLITRTALYEHVFDENDNTLSNLIDVHISNLRKKLGHDLITTRRGLGYCIE